MNNNRELEQPSCLILSDVFVSLLVFQGASGAVDARLASVQPGHGNRVAPERGEALLSGWRQEGHHRHNQAMIQG